MLIHADCPAQCAACYADELAASKSIAAFAARGMVSTPDRRTHRCPECGQWDGHRTGWLHQSVRLMLPFAVLFGPILAAPIISMALSHLLIREDHDEDQSSCNPHGDCHCWSVV